MTKHMTKLLNNTRTVRLRNQIAQQLKGKGLMATIPYAVPLFLGAGVTALQCLDPLLHNVTLFIK